MLDAILLPIGEGNRILRQVAVGKVDELIAQTYEGDHERMKQSVNGIALVIQRFQTDLSPSSLHSEVESWVAVTPIVTVFLCSVERRFSVPAAFVSAVARRAWVAVTPIVTVFLCSVERRFSVPAAFVSAVARSLGQA